ncbi:hypothetical protein BYT27DRAFT_6781840 [Phlegmacium glaucopus]|nr:hypothetical protein BYT27DRAFT_6781840 [Phlegmacium glaucopus]
MKFSLVPLIALALTTTSVMALPEPAPAAAEPTIYTPPVDTRALEKRAIVIGTVEVDGLKHRSCPRTTCTANGQYAIGTHISIVCFTRTDTTVVNGDAGWAKLTTGDWVALSFGQFVSWSGSILPC